MIQGVYLTLLAGPMVPVPVPAAVVDGLTSVKVTVATREPGPGGMQVPARSGFEMTFVLGKKSPLETMFLLAGGGPPTLRVVLVATVNGVPSVLADGFVQEHAFTPGSGTTPPSLTVRGKDVSTALDLVEFSGLPYPAMPVPARVAFILAKYAVLGVVPAVFPTVVPDVADPTDKIHSHKGTDYQYLCALAAAAGYTFYIDPGPAPGVNTAYWGPEVKVGVPQPALNLDMDELTNVESLSFQLDNHRHTIPVGFLRLDAVPVPIPVPVPDISLTNPPLGLVPPRSLRFEALPDVAKMSLPQAIQYALSRSAGSAESVTASGTLNVARYGRVLKARQLVGVRGAGTAFDGLYYVQSVTHELRRGEYKQSFKLSRNALVSTVPRVPA